MSNENGSGQINWAETLQANRFNEFAVEVPHMGQTLTFRCMPIPPGELFAKYYAPWWAYQSDKPKFDTMGGDAMKGEYETFIKDRQPLHNNPEYRAMMRWIVCTSCLEPRFMDAPQSECDKHNAVTVHALGGNQLSELAAAIKEQSLSVEDERRIVDMFREITNTNGSSSPVESGEDGTDLSSAPIDTAV